MVKDNHFKYVPNIALKILSRLPFNCCLTCSAVTNNKDDGDCMDFYTVENKWRSYIFCLNNQKQNAVLSQLNALSELNILVNCRNLIPGKSNTKQCTGLKSECKENAHPLCFTKINRDFISVIKQFWIKFKCVCYIRFFNFAGCIFLKYYDRKIQISFKQIKCIQILNNSGLPISYILKCDSFLQYLEFLFALSSNSIDHPMTILDSFYYYLLTPGALLPKWLPTFINFIEFRCIFKYFGILITPNSSFVSESVKNDLSRFYTTVIRSNYPIVLCTRDCRLPVFNCLFDQFYNLIKNKLISDAFLIPVSIATDKLFDKNAYLRLSFSAHLSLQNLSKSYNSKYNSSLAKSPAEFISHHVFYDCITSQPLKLSSILEYILISTGHPMDIAELNSRFNNLIDSLIYMKRQILYLDYYSLKYELDIPKSLLDKSNAVFDGKLITFDSTKLWQIFDDCFPLFCTLLPISIISFTILTMMQSKNKLINTASSQQFRFYQMNMNDKYMEILSFFSRIFCLKICQFDENIVSQAFDYLLCEELVNIVPCPKRTKIAAFGYSDSEEEPNAQFTIKTSMTNKLLFYCRHFEFILTAVYNILIELIRLKNFTCKITARNI
ncbi:hypothetical protein HZS_4825 [Henneguya salminicola]|nr:hypothetical protein HZS_4825 [Henneguya salminicola]